MKVLASSVIRSTHRGDSHGGLYIVDTFAQRFKQVLDWDYEKIRWEGKGGDRGLRGLIFHGDYLYAAGANEIFVFNRDFELIKQYTHHLLDGTHELAIENNILYNISNCFDAILPFDLTTEKWLLGFQHIKGRHPQVFDPNTHMIQRADTMHLDTITVKDGWIWYAGSTTDQLYGFNLQTRETQAISLVHKNTHNAQFWKDGIVFNRSLEGDTTYQVAGEIKANWPTPRCDRAWMTCAGLPADHARAEYTRGMAILNSSVCVGSSPACIHEFQLGHTEPVSTVRLTNDIRNSICGMTNYAW